MDSFSSKDYDKGYVKGLMDLDDILLYDNMISKGRAYGKNWKLEYDLISKEFNWDRFTRLNSRPTDSALPGLKVINRLLDLYEQVIL